LIFLNFFSPQPPFAGDSLKLNVDSLSYLALISGIVSEADYVFIPESPPPQDWARKLCDKLMQARPNLPPIQTHYHASKFKSWWILAIS
jgi:hypothetical protein